MNKMMKPFDEFDRCLFMWLRSKFCEKYICFVNNFVKFAGRWRRNLFSIITHSMTFKKKQRMLGLLYFLFVIVISIKGRSELQ